MSELLKNWKTEYKGAAIYSLVDPNGKRYIGQAKNLKHRLYAHYLAFCVVDSATEGVKLKEAINSKIPFRVEILKYIQWDKSSVNELRYWEQYYCDLYGGINETYNTASIPPPNYFYDGFNDVVLSIDLNRKTDADIIEHLNMCENVQGYLKNLIRKDMGA